MKTALVQIGNSRGVRIPKAFLEHCQLRDTVELKLRDDHLIVRPTIPSRHGWDDAFLRMRECGDDALLDDEFAPATEWAATPDG